MVRQQSAASAAFLWGVTLGMAVVVVGVLGRFVLSSVARRALNGALTSGRMIVGGVVLVAALELFFLAGALAARRARTIEAGIFAGLIAGTTAGVVNLGLAILSTTTLRGGVLARAPQLRALLVGVVGSGIVALLRTLLAGTALGALGALLGRGRGMPLPPSVLPPPGGYTPPVTSPAGTFFAPHATDAEDSGLA